MSLARMLFSLFAMLLAIAQSEAHAARRALVVGNDSYAQIARLEKAVNDARSMGSALTALGFETTVVADADRRGMNRALQEFAAAIEEGDTALFFYAGHGVEISGRNYLLPVDTPASTGDDSDFIAAEAVGVDDLLERLRERNPQLSIVILDACRNNPFARTGTRSIGAEAGLARISAPQGSFVMYSADVGEAALDSLGPSDADPNSVFTRTLLPLLADPALDLVDTAREVRRKVRDLASTARHRQTPAYYDAVLGDFRFASLSPKDDDAEPPAAPKPDAEEPQVREPGAEPLAAAMVATGGEKDSVKVWDAGTGALLAELAGEKIVLSTLAFVDKGSELVVAGSDGALFAYRLPEFKKVRAAYPGFRVTTVAETPSGLLAGGSDGTVALLGAADWAVVWKKRLHGGIVSPILIEGEDAISASEDGSVLRFDPKTGAPVRRTETGRPVTDVALFGGGSALAVHEDGMATRLDLARGEAGETFRANKGWVSAVVRTGRGSGFVTAGVDGELAFWTAGARQPLFALPGHGDVATSVRMLRVGGDDLLVSTGFDGALKLWSLAGEPVREFDHGSAILHVAHFSGGGL